MAKLTDLASLSSLLSSEQRSALEADAVKAKAAKPLGEGKSVRLLLDKKLRRGKSVTLVTGLTGHKGGKEELLKLLKQELGVGGTLNEDGNLEIQGDQRAKLQKSLEKKGFDVKQ